MRRWTYEKAISGSMKWMASLNLEVPAFGERLNFWGVGNTKASARRHAAAKFEAFRAALNRVTVGGVR